MQAVAPGATPSPDGPDPQLWVPVFETEQLSLLLAVFAVPTATATEKQAMALTLVPEGELLTEVSLGGGLIVRFEASEQVLGAALVLVRTTTRWCSSTSTALRGLRRWPDRG